MTELGGRSFFSKQKVDNEVAYRANSTNCYKSDRTNKTARRGENVIIFIIARQGGKSGGIWRVFLFPRRMIYRP